MYQNIFPGLKAYYYLDLIGIYTVCLMNICRQNLDNIYKHIQTYTNIYKHMMKSPQQNFYQIHLLVKYLKIDLSENNIVFLNVRKPDI